MQGHWRGIKAGTWDFEGCAVALRDNSTRAWEGEGPGRVIESGGDMGVEGDRSLE